MYIQAIIKPEALWSEQRKVSISWIDQLKSHILPVVAIVAILSGILSMVLRIPMAKQF